MQLLILCSHLAQHNCNSHSAELCNGRARSYIFISLTLTFLSCWLGLCSKFRATARQLAFHDWLWIDQLPYIKVSTKDTQLDLIWIKIKNPSLLLKWIFTSDLCWINIVDICIIIIYLQRVYCIVSLLEHKAHYIYGSWTFSSWWS